MESLLQPINFKNLKNHPASMMFFFTGLARVRKVTLWQKENKFYALPTNGNDPLSWRKIWSLWRLRKYINKEFKRRYPDDNIKFVTRVPRGSKPVKNAEDYWNRKRE